MTDPTILEQASNVTLFGQTFNIWAMMILFIFAVIIYGLDKARRTKAIDWLDLVTSVDQATGEVQASATKIMQLIGGITGTFIVVKLTLQNAINWDIFGIYLAYISSAEGFSRFMLAKYGVTQLPTPVVAPTPAPAPTVPVVTTTTVTTESARPVDNGS